MKYLVLAHFEDDDSIAYYWSDSEQDAKEWIDSYKKDFNDFVVDEFIKINSMEKISHK